MAKLYFGIDKGGDYLDVVTDSSTTGKDVELVIDDTDLPAAAVDKRFYVERALDAFKHSLREYEF